MKKFIVALLVCFIALIPVTVFANEYNYSATKSRLHNTL